MDKKKIVLISTIYKTPKAQNGTAVCNYFTKEWVKMGHSVLSIYIHTNYPFFLYWPTILFEKRIASKTGAVVYTKADKNQYHFQEDGVDVYQIPVLKYIPHKRYAKQSIKNAINKIAEIIKEHFGCADIIVGHFPNPQIEIVGALKNLYPKSTTAIVMHGDLGFIRNIYGYNSVNDIPNIDIWGFRSKTVQNNFTSIYGMPKRTFLCYSGIPEYYLNDIKNRTHVQFNSFIYIGELIERKYPTKVLKALDIAFPENDYVLKYIGEGGEKSNIIDSVHGRDNIQLIGKIPRNDIISHLDNSDCMIMISRWEAFGLVYIEAMSRGCITIASKNEGVDGIIIDGYNGFLCKAGDADELAEILKKLRLMSPEERSKISTNAIKTASELTDFKVAKQYIDDVINL